MKVLAICCSVCALCLGICASGFSEPVDQQVQALEDKLNILEAMYVKTAQEMQAVAQEAKPVFDKAERILKAKKDNFTCQEKVTINLAAYYEQYLGRLATFLKLILLQGYLVNEKIETLKKMREA
jgi:hypothetical protein